MRSFVLTALMLFVGSSSVQADPSGYWQYGHEGPHIKLTPLSIGLARLLNSRRIPTDYITLKGAWSGTVRLRDCPAVLKRMQVENPELHNPASLSDGEIRVDSAEIWASVRKELAPQVKAPDVDFDKYEVRIIFIDKANPNWIEIGFSSGPNPIIGGPGSSTCLGYRRTDSSVFVCFLIDKRGLSNAQSLKQKP